MVGAIKDHLQWNIKITGSPPISNWWHELPSDSYVSDRCLSITSITPPQFDDLLPIGKMTPYAGIWMGMRHKWIEEFRPNQTTFISIVLFKQSQTKATASVPIINVLMLL